ncbi:CarboxypepD_reg-like domain-containing protein [Parafilimonas terrae]|uniref:CarboxypepD_reg-like domain-containing protein n=2 Tax=Parafilimonas terrae TaxID=1465490 RepID=A0A1I5YVQ2_9BACT|nr:CarboxypepD_reg-like domain-containing protein [Parafilimonas terrae]
MQKILPLLFIFFSTTAFAARITGTIKDDKGNALPYASVSIKEKGSGTTANQQGYYSLELAPGDYTIIVQYVGFARQEKKVHITGTGMQLDFELKPSQLQLKDVVVSSNGEDPAYAIIRNAIKKRQAYHDALDSFTCEAYIKTLIKTRALPRKVFGQKIDSADWKQMGVDSAGKGVIYLSESLTKIAFKKPDKIKLEVLSGRESGSNGFGFTIPTFIDFYTNNVQIMGGQFAPRGYVCPIADGALNFYKYHFLGSFFEDGREINRIQVIPRRKYEPLFSGTIEITEGDWRIYSVDLMLTKESQLEILDTVKITQIHFPVTKNVWRTKNQVLYFTFNKFGIDAVGNFLNVYNNYDVTPAFKKKFFNNIIMQFDTGVNKKTAAYWDSVRPVPLEQEEIKDYKVKDSIYRYQRDSSFTKRYRDSLRRMQGKISVMNVLWNGFTRSNYNPENYTTIQWQPLLKQVQYNTVEGLVLNGEATFSRGFPSINRELSFTPHVRYGFSNEHFNAYATLNYHNRSNWRGISNDADDNTSSFRSNNFSLSGGRRISQFNKGNPISPLFNSIYTLFFNHNYMKIYENKFLQFDYYGTSQSGLKYAANLLYEDRMPLDNTTDFSIIKYDNKKLTPNYPYEKMDSQFIRHQAVIAGISLSYQPGQKYVQFPNYRVPLGSKYPTFTLSYQKGFNKIFGSDADFDKWNFSVTDDMNFKLAGQLNYRIDIGGFLNDKSVFIQDYRHFNGNQLIFASRYLYSFQIAPYYANSTTAAFYTTLHAEHHFNGLLTNKIPLFKRLNWNLVAGTNAFYVNGNNNYVEIFGGLENIFKLFRVDVVGSYLNGKNGQVAVRIGLGGLLGGKIRLN